MKKLIPLLLPALLLSMVCRAQISFTQPEKKIAENFIGLTDTSVVNLFLKDIKSTSWIKLISDRNEWERKVKDTIRKVITAANNERKNIILSNQIINKDSAIAAVNKKEDTLISAFKKKIKLRSYWERFQRFEDKENVFLNFFPAYYASQTKIFFEGDTSYIRFFANNSINYNPINKKMALYTEVVNDYFGPIRLDIGFMLRSNTKDDSSLSKNADTLKMIEKQSDLITALQNGGGDISINAKYPIAYNVDKDNLLNVKLYAFFNTGFALPVVNEATDKFYANYDGGLEGFVFIKGFTNKISFFAQTKNAYYFGNRAFRKIIRDLNPTDPSSFFLGQAAVGFDFMDSFRLRVDFYYGNSFVRKNFPNSITFVVRPKSKDKDN